MSTRRVARMTVEGCPAWRGFCFLRSDNELLEMVAYRRQQATADGSINWAEGQAPSTVNDSAHHRSDRRRRRRVGGLDRNRLCRRPLAREDRAHDLEPAMTARRPQSERLAVLEQQVSHMEAELDRMSAKVDEMHAILLQARGVRWAIIALAGLVGFLAGLSHWVIARV